MVPQALKEPLDKPEHKVPVASVLAARLVPSALPEFKVQLATRARKARRWWDPPDPLVALVRPERKAKSEIRVPKAPIRLARLAQPVLPVIQARKGLQAQRGHKVPRV